MATLIPGVERKSEAVRVSAAMANSVPELRDQVVKLAEVVEKLEDKIKRLEQK